MIVKRPMTLIEVLAAMGIIIILAGLLFPAAHKLWMRSRAKALIAEMEGMRDALEAYYEDYGAYPTPDLPTVGRTQGIIDAKLDERYDCDFFIKGDQWVDPWDMEILYLLKGVRLILVSYGPDALYETDDDIKVR